MNTSRPLILSAAAVSVAALSACGGSGSSQPTAPTIQPARTFELTDFEPSGQVDARQAGDGRLHDPRSRTDSRSTTTAAAPARTRACT